MALSHQLPITRRVRVGFPGLASYYTTIQHTQVPGMELEFCCSEGPPIYHGDDRYFISANAGL